jgi:hypothetical protein
MDTTVQRDKIASGVEQITLGDMNKKYNLEKILLEAGTGAEYLLACWLTQKHFKRRIKSFKTKVTDNRLLDRVLVESKWYTISLLTTKLPDLIDRAHLFMLMEADQTGWYRKMEYKDLEELLSSILDDTEEQSSESYDWRFIVEKMAPAARSFGIKPEKFGNATHQIKKLRQSVPAARLILKLHETGEITEAKARKDLKWVIESVADPEISHTQLKPELDKYRGILPDIEVKIKGNIYLTGNDSAVLLISVKDQVELRIIEQRLNKRVDFVVSDYKDFAETALALLDIKEKSL